MTTKGATGPQQCVSGVYNVTPISLSDGQQAPLQLASNGAVLISGSISAVSSLVATAVAPTYVEGSTNPFSSDLSGGLRITGTINATSAAQATTAPPSYTNNTSNAFSQNLTGDLRTISKQNGTWTVGIDQITASANAVSQAGVWGVNINAAQTIAVTNAGVFAVQAAQSGTWNITNVSGTISLPTGAATSALQTTINTTLGSPFQAGGSIGNTTFAATQSGTWNIGTVTTITGVTTAFGAISSTLPANAVLDGSRGATTNPTAVTDGQLVANMADKLGRQVVVIGNVRDNKASNSITLSSTTAGTLVTGIASVLNDIYGLIAANQSATGVTITLSSSSGATGIPIYIPANDTRGFMLASSDGLKQGTVNTNWTATLSAPAITVKATAFYVKNT